MTHKFTPFLVLSIGFVLFGLHNFFFGGNLGPPAGMLIIVIGGFFFGMYYFLRKMLKIKFLYQVITELLIIIIVSFIYYRLNDKLILRVPYNYTGHILIVYGVRGKLKLESDNFFTPVINKDVPVSGIIFTSSKPGAKILLDTSEGRTKPVQPGYGIPILSGNLNCKNNYRYSIIVLGKLPRQWHPFNDSSNRNRKQVLACRLLNQ